MMREKMVSVIIPTYNRAGFMAETLDSVWNQNYRPIEVLIVDDGSTDDTASVINHWLANHAESKSFAVGYHHQKNTGAPAARNYGAELSKGGYLMFLDSDDLLGRESIAAMMRALGNSAFGLIACRWFFWRQKSSGWVKESGKPLGDEDENQLRKWLGGWYIPPCALLWERSAYRKTGGWDESLAANQDGDLVLRYLAGGGTINLADGGVSHYRKHAGKTSVSEKRTKETIQSREKVLDKLEHQLRHNHKFHRYKDDFAAAYYFLACEAYFHRFRAYGNQLQKKVKAIDPSFRTDNRLHRWLENVMGTYRKERLHRFFNFVWPDRSV